MKIKLNGGPEDLIQRCEGCDYCIFEDILTPDQRKIKVLDKPIPINHAHRASIEYACDQNHDEVCPMKYAAMRGIVSDDVACQLGAIKDYMWDLGKKFDRPFYYPEAISIWAKDQDLGRGKLEKLAQRFRDVWNLGIRNIVKGDGKTVTRQNLTSPEIYEIVVSSPEVYDAALYVLKKLKDEAESRARR